jgi:hypothetical protein
MDAVITQDDEDTESTVSQKVTRAWKGFDKDFKCRGFVYQVGETYKEDGDPVICQSGFHACTTPIDALIYYPMTDYSRYAEVDLIGDTVAHEESGQDSKIAASRIRIVREISYFELWAAHRAWAEEQVNEASATGDSGHASATGNSGHASATGDSGHASATGDRGHASATGDRGHASATGNSGHASATGDSGHASATGNSGHASATGDRGHASATGNSGHASATGNSGHASATGYSGHASATGDRGHASATGNSGHASATGDRGHASATGNSGHASATGKNAIAASLGIESRAKASAGNWLVLAAYADHTDNYRLLLVKTAKCGNGENELKPDIWYRLSSDGEFVECEDEGASE